MSADSRAPRCTQCGYALTGSASGRCPECGHQSRMRERWREGELHLEGPLVVMPVFVRAMVACALMCVGVLMFLLLDEAFLDALGLRVRIDARWMVVPMALLSPLVAWLWARPIRSDDAHHFDLHDGSSWRTWLPLSLLIWWLFAVLRVVDIQSSAARAAASAAAGTKPVPDETLLVACALLGIAGQIPWILVLRHVGRLGAYLRDTALARTATIWSWVWLGGMLLAPLGSVFVRRYTGVGSVSGMVQVLFAFSCLGFAVGTVMACRLFWTLANCLTLAHEEVARAKRRDERERSRYATPD
ncbi:MAG: hypothetical protein RLZZ288_65 [Planctomycetota bacterium]